MDVEDICQVRQQCCYGHRLSPGQTGWSAARLYTHILSQYCLLNATLISSNESISNTVQCLQRLIQQKLILAR